MDSSEYTLLVHIAIIYSQWYNTEFLTSSYSNWPHWALWHIHAGDIIRGSMQTLLNRNFNRFSNIRIGDTLGMSSWL